MQSQGHSRMTAPSGSRETSEGYGAQAEHLMQGMNEWVSRDPQTAVLTCFAVGAGIGLVVGLSLGGGRKHAGEHASWFDRRTAEDVGRRILDSVTHMLPTSIADKFGVSS